MANFAIIIGNVVSNVIVADTEEDAKIVSPSFATVVDVTDQPVYVGLAYDGKDFIYPEVIPAPLPSATQGA